MPIQNPRRRASLLWAAVIAMTTGVVMVNAVQTVTMPNASTMTYKLASGAFTGPIFPVNDRPVFVMGTQTSTIQLRPGAGQVTLVRIAGSYLAWTGNEPFAGVCDTTCGLNNAVGTHILYLDGSHQVDIEIGVTPDQIRVHNGSPVTATGWVTLIW